MISIIVILFALVPILCIIAAAILALNDQEYAGFLVVGAFVFLLNLFFVTRMIMDKVIS